ncbi:MAG: hypothetical protein KZQ97_17700 [Candidatus Thiodiazotropha sp. (ex Dulcina madagascariensis)]|nr:hypothetical protein [Candidatus Thiodiazotropha sp. (ex Dulcina madagascariensis)]
MTDEEWKKSANASINDLRAEGLNVKKVSINIAISFEGVPCHSFIPGILRSFADHHAG